MEKFSTVRMDEVTLPKDAIYDYILKEEIVDVHYAVNARGAIKDRSVELVKERTISGLFLAWPDYDNHLIMIGFSRCKPNTNGNGDDFNMVDAVKVAMDRAESFNYDFHDGMVPKAIFGQFCAFLTRCRSYYKQISFPNWSFNLYQHMTDD